MFFFGSEPTAKLHVALERAKEGRTKVIRNRRSGIENKLQDGR
jgi:hypothetical protein